jgi:dimethylamine corrinoid protein
MTEVGRKYEAGEYYLAEFEISAGVMTKGLNVLKLIVPWESGGGQTVVLATVKGDMHDMGKVLVGSLLTASGYKVVDAGIDMPAEKIVEVARENARSERFGGRGRQGGRGAARGGPARPR